MRFWDTAWTWIRRIGNLRSTDLISRRDQIIIAIVVPILLLLIVCVRTDFFGFYTNPFSRADLDGYEQSVADLDSLMATDRVIKPQETAAMRMAARMAGHPTEPLPVWKELRRLLEKRRPSPAEFRQMQKRITELQVLAGLSEVTYMDEELAELRAKVGKWHTQIWLQDLRRK